MSEEEKQAIEYWKRDIELYHYNTQLASEYYAQIILKLIEKQQKELEQEKEKNKELEDVVKLMSIALTPFETSTNGVIWTSSEVRNTFFETIKKK